MKAEYKHISFKLQSSGIWWIVNRKQGGVIGMISWYWRWRRFVFEGCADAVFDEGCLRDIIDFLQQLKEKRKKAAPLFQQTQTESGTDAETNKAKSQH
jgi:hypothetical protein